MERRVKVVYDDGCPTCTVGANVAQKLDRRGDMDFVGMNTDEGRQLVRDHGLNMEKSAYLLGDGAISERAHMMRDVLSRGGIAGFLMSLPFRIPAVGNALYDLLALHRRHVTKSKQAPIINIEA